MSLKSNMQTMSLKLGPYLPKKLFLFAEIKTHSK